MPPKKNTKARPLQGRSAEMTTSLQTGQGHLTPNQGGLAAEEIRLIVLNGSPFPVPACVLPWHTLCLECFKGISPRQLVVSIVCHQSDVSADLAQSRRDAFVEP